MILSTLIDTVIPYGNTQDVHLAINYDHFILHVIEQFNCYKHTSNPKCLTELLPCFNESKSAITPGSCIGFLPTYSEIEFL